MFFYVSILPYLKQFALCVFFTIIIIKYECVICLDVLKYEIKNCKLFNYNFYLKKINENPNKFLTCLKKNLLIFLFSMINLLKGLKANFYYFKLFMIIYFFWGFVVVVVVVYF